MANNIGPTDPETVQTKGEAVKGEGIDNVRNDTASVTSIAKVGRQNLADAVPPHESYEGAHRWDPTATWTPEEEKRVIRKTDIYLMSWLCLMVSGIILWFCR